VNCCWLAVCIVVVFLCVLLLVGRVYCCSCLVLLLLVGRVYCCSCLVLLLLVGRVYCCNCLVCIVVVVVCIVVVILCVLLSSYVYLSYFVCIAVFTLDAGLLDRSQYSEGPETGHLPQVFLGLPVPKSKC